MSWLRLWTLRGFRGARETETLSLLSRVQILILIYKIQLCTDTAPYALLPGSATEGDRQVKVQLVHPEDRKGRGQKGRVTVTVQKESEAIYIGEPIGD